MSQLHESFRIQQQNENEAVASPKLDHVKHTSPKMSYARAPFKAFLHGTRSEYTTNTLVQKKES